MYVPTAFDEPDKATLHEFMRRHSFATLVTRGGEGLVASHLPLVLEPGGGPNGVLFGHMARANPQWRSVEGETLAIFHGPHTYISPAWYEEAGTVPTWNYVVVHAYGTFQAVEGREGMLDILQRSVDAYEGGRANPWPFDPGAPHVERLLGAIVGFRLEITRLEGKWKLSQNHTEGRRRKAIDGLRERTDHDSQAIARLMQDGLGTG